jgi:phosphoglycolate phosphatase-like HAD superfamily hydrolase
MHVLWDLDGTIVDTIPSLVDTFCILASEYHGIETDRTLVDELTRVNSEVLFAHYNIPYDEANIALFRDINSQIDVESMPLFEGVEENKTNYLVTNRNRKSTEQILHHLNIHHYFKEIVCVGFQNTTNIEYGYW